MSVIGMAAFVVVAILHAHGGLTDSVALVLFIACMAAIARDLD